MKKRVGNNIKISKLVLITALFLFVAIILRASQLALADEIDDVNLQEFAKKRTTKKEIIKAPRGTIYTSDGEVLAQNVSSYTIIAYLDPKRTEDESKPQHVIDKAVTAKALAPILNLNEDKILEYLSKENIYQTEFGVQGRGLTEITKDKIVSLNLPGIDFIETQKRYYPNGDYLSYVIGYAKTDEDGNIIGELGIEKEYDDILRGEDGYILYQKDLRGYKIPNTKVRKKDAVAGKDIYLSIDSNIQFFVEQAIKNSTNGYNFEWLTMVIADAKTGKILASGSSPSFDPNIKNITNYLDPNVSFTYEPGSTMKIFTYMAAMENGSYDGTATFLSGTYTTTDGTVIGDHDRKGWGYITYDKGFAYSSNVGVVNLINSGLSKEFLKNYYKKLGFGSKSGIELPQEAKGKIDFKYETEIYNAGFGQGITTTPMQNIKALTSLTNDGILLKPYIISKIIDPTTKEVMYKGKREEIEQVASTKTVDKIRELMYDTVNVKGNTGSPYRMDGYNLIGKTGTAQIASTDGSGYLTGKSDIIASFSGIYPGDNPEIIIYASVKRPGNGSQLPVTTAVKEVITNVSKYKGLDTVNVNKEQIATYNMPSFINDNVNDVINTLNNNLIPTIVIGDGTRVIKQYPAKDSVVSSKDKVFLITNSSNYTLPNMIGWSKQEVLTLLTFLNVNYQSEGVGYVTSQSLAAGTLITNDMNVTITFSPKF